MSKNVNRGHGVLLLFVAFIEYIVFSSQVPGIIALFAVPAISSVLYGLNSRNQYVSCLILAMVVSGTTYYLTWDNNIFLYIITFAQIHLPAYIICNCFSRKNSNFKETIALLTITNIIFVIADLAIIKYKHQIDIMSTYISAFDEYIQSAALVAGSTGVLGDLSQQQITDLLNTFKETVVMLIPSLLIISTIIFSFVTAQLTKLIYKTYLKYNNPEQNFTSFSAGVLLSLINIVLLLISFMNKKPMINGITNNFMVVSMFIYAAHGLAVVSHFVYKKVKNSFTALIILVLLFVVLFVSTALIGSVGGLSILFYLGIFDSCFDFRRLKKK